ncbi:MAG TPA: c-type cytochrome biogenesis protein CcmI, partial [Phenylobacterium sp.]|nr:c-type cytochrome biogenesis protein CcmI [Phenylobacterium sp.]
EIDDLAARGLIEETERKAAHAEAGRRLLTAADQVAQPWTASPGQRRPVLVVATLAPLAALGLYLLVGAPGFPDQSIKSRIAQWRQTDLASLTAPQMAAVLRQVTAEHPDPEGYRFLAMAENQSDNPSGAARALRKAITLAPQRGDLWEMLGVSLVAEAGGQETPGAVTAFNQALKLDPHAVLARFHLARAQAQGGDRPGAVTALKALQADLAADDPRRESLAQAIADAEGEPPAAAAPFAGGQLEMIRGMVARQAAKLKANPDDPEGWVRLVRSYAVLSDVKARDAALAEARARYRGRADILGQLDVAAKTEPMK